MKWNVPKPLFISVAPSWHEIELVPSENDPAFADFNLPLLDQESVISRKIEWQKPTPTPRTRTAWPWKM
jgi:hypothetical protein